jgi:cytochrome c-type biogenesis protein CcmH/NrfG
MIRRWSLAATLLLAIPFIALLFMFGRPDPPPPPAKLRADTAFARERSGWLRAEAEDANWLAFADALHRQGLDAQATSTMAARVRSSPRSAALWTGYANAMVVEAGGKVTPKAHAAFRQAVQLAPGEPGPRYLFGAALLGAGRRDEALAVWTALRDGGEPGTRWVDQLDATIARVRAGGPATVAPPT